MLPKRKHISLENVIEKKRIRKEEHNITEQNKTNIPAEKIATRAQCCEPNKNQTIQLQQQHQYSVAAAVISVSFSLDSLYRMPINYIILSLMESGELTKLQNKWWHEQAKCTAANKKSHPEFYPNDGLALNNLAGIFFVLIVGLILSLFVAIIEFCFKQHDPMKQHQKFKTKPSATGTAMNTLQGKPKLTIQEQRDFDNGRVTVSMQI